MHRKGDTGGYAPHPGDPWHPGWQPEATWEGEPEPLAEGTDDTAPADDVGDGIDDTVERRRRRRWSWLGRDRDEDLDAASSVQSVYDVLRDLPGNNATVAEPDLDEDGGLDVTEVVRVGAQDDLEGDLSQRFAATQIESAPVDDRPDAAIAPPATAALVAEVAWEADPATFGTLPDDAPVVTTPVVAAASDVSAAATAGVMDPEASVAVLDEPNVAAPPVPSTGASHDEGSSRTGDAGSAGSGHGGGTDAQPGPEMADFLRLLAEELRDAEAEALAAELSRFAEQRDAALRAELEEARRLAAEAEVRARAEAEARAAELAAQAAAVESSWRMVGALLEEQRVHEEAALAIELAKVEAARLAEAEREAEVVRLRREQELAWLQAQEAEAAARRATEEAAAAEIEAHLADEAERARLAEEQAARAEARAEAEAEAERRRAAWEAEERLRAARRAAEEQRRAEAEMRRRAIVEAARHAAEHERRVAAARLERAEAAARAALAAADAAPFAEPPTTQPMTTEPDAETAAQSMPEAASSPVTPDTTSDPVEPVASKPKAPMPPAPAPVESVPQQLDVFATARDAEDQVGGAEAEIGSADRVAAPKIDRERVEAAERAALAALAAAEEAVTEQPAIEVAPDSDTEDEATPEAEVAPEAPIASENEIVSEDEGAIETEADAGRGEDADEQDGSDADVVIDLTVIDGPTAIDEAGVAPVGSPDPVAPGAPTGAATLALRRQITIDLTGVAASTAVTSGDVAGVEPVIRTRATAAMLAEWRFPPLPIVAAVPAAVGLDEDEDRESEAADEVDVTNAVAGVALVEPSVEPGADDEAPADDDVAAWMAYTESLAAAAPPAPSLWSRITRMFRRRDVSGEAAPTATADGAPVAAMPRDAAPQDAEPAEALAADTPSDAPPSGALASDALLSGAPASDGGSAFEPAEEPAASAAEEAADGIRPFGEHSLIRIIPAARDEAPETDASDDDPAPPMDATSPIDGEGLPEGTDVESAADESPAETGAASEPQVETDIAVTDLAEPGVVEIGVAEVDDEPHLETEDAAVEADVGRSAETVPGEDLHHDEDLAYLLDVGLGEFAPEAPIGAQLEPETVIGSTSEEHVVAGTADEEHPDRDLPVPDGGTDDDIFDEFEDLGRFELPAFDLHEEEDLADRAESEASTDESAGEIAAETQGVVDAEIDDELTPDLPSHGAATNEDGVVEAHASEAFDTAEWEFVEEPPQLDDESWEDEEVPAPPTADTVVDEGAIGGDGIDEDGIEEQDEAWWEELTAERYVQASTTEHQGLAEAVARAAHETVEQSPLAASMPGLDSGLVGLEDVVAAETGEHEAVEPRAASDLPARVATALGLIGAFLASLLWEPALATLIFVVLGIAAGEFYTVLTRKGHHPVALIGYLGIAGALLGTWLWGEVAVPASLALTAVALLLFFAVTGERRRPLEDLALTMLGAAWIGGFGAFALAIIKGPDFRWLIVAVVATVAASDVAQYFVGKRWGKRPLAPKVSPKKTVEGYLGGVATALVVGTIMGILGPMEPIQGLAFGAVVAIFGPLGDLAVSAFKRSLGVKDMGVILPGHGGVLDRIDAMLFVVPAAWVLFSWMGLVG